MQYIHKLATAIGISIIMPTALAAFNIQNLKTDHLSTPLGLDGRQPSFSWQMTYDSEEKPLGQKATSTRHTDASRVHGSQTATGSPTTSACQPTPRPH